jgi:hypothetical protein
MAKQNVWRAHWNRQTHVKQRSSEPYPTSVGKDVRCAHVHLTLMCPRPYLNVCVIRGKIVSLRMLTNLRLADVRLTTAQQRSLGHNLPPTLYELIVGVWEPNAYHNKTANCRLPLGTCDGGSNCPFIDEEFGYRASQITSLSLCFSRETDHPHSEHTNTRSFRKLTAVGSLWCLICYETIL